MKKTIDINLAGLRFSLDEDAYQRLQAYLRALESQLAQTVGKEEILADIEGRIAELFTVNLNTGKQVINLAEVDAVISTMGAPEDFAGDDAEGGRVAGDWQPLGAEESNKKRLFRDADDRVVGGVASGLAAYFEVDPVVVRLLWAASIFLGGLGVWLYLIMWVVVPPARTTADRLRMRGEKVNWKNIQKTVEDELNGVADRVDRFARGEKMGRSQGARVANEIVQTTGQVLVYILKFVAKFIGGLFIGLSIAAGIGLTVVTFGRGLTFNGAVIEPEQLGTFLDVFAPDGLTSSTIILLILMLLLGPVVGIFTVGARILFGLPWRHKGLRLAGLVATIVSVVAVVVASFWGVRTAHEFEEESIVTENQTLPEGRANWRVVTHFAPIDEAEARLHFDDEESDGEWIFTQNQLYTNLVDFTVESASGSQAYLVVERIAHGASGRVARERAQKIDYKLDARPDGTLDLNALVGIDRADKFRGQRVKVTLYLPVGHTVYLDPSTMDVLDDVPNLENTYDHDMVGLTWTMTEGGLTQFSNRSAPAPSESKVY
jgi:phage shock protein PspC (stress-responsive transcriptional regulator)